MHPIYSEVTNIEKTLPTLVDRLQIWSSINSSSYNLEGLEQMLTLLGEEFRSLKGQQKIISLPPQQTLSPEGKIVSTPLGRALYIEKRPLAKKQICLVGHMDTVFPKESHFQQTKKKEKNILEGPGVADMKGGLLVMLTALKALESHPAAMNVGWKIILNPDEEMGSPGSRHLIQSTAKQCHIGLGFEPTFPDGYFVSTRKGSAVYSLFFQGKGAHVGRNYHEGKNAIHALGEAISQFELLSLKRQDIILSIGFVQGGGAVNIVPDQAFCRLSVRFNTLEESQFIDQELHAILEKIKLTKGFDFLLLQESFRPPKYWNSDTEALFDRFSSAAEILKIPFQTRPTGGVCDGNLIAQEGIPTLDTLGVRGGGLHTENEYMEIQSLITQSQLSALFLIQYAMDLT